MPQPMHPRNAMYWPGTPIFLRFVFCKNVLMWIPNKFYFANFYSIKYLAIWQHNGSFYSSHGTVWWITHCGSETSSLSFVLCFTPVASKRLIVHQHVDLLAVSHGPCPYPLASVSVRCCTESSALTLSAGPLMSFLVKPRERGGDCSGTVRDWL